ncbi:MAG: mobile mystery protein A [Gaiellaceae bacterium]
MPKKTATSLARRSLDRRLLAWRALGDAPPHGWIRALRDALGMSTSQLGKRMGLSRQAIAQMEQSEADGSIRLDTLRRAAMALDCDVVYALVPRQPLQETVDERARTLAHRTVDRVRHTMSLEDQAGGADDEASLVEELAEELKSSRRLWLD